MVFTFLSPALAQADEISRADKLRTLYSAEFRFTAEGLPIVPVAVVQNAAAVTVSATRGLKLMPDGEAGSVVEAAESFRVVAKETRAARMRFWPAAFRGKPGKGAELARQSEAWKRKGVEAKIFEQGTLFGVAGEVLDRREMILGVSPQETWDAAQRSLARLQQADASAPFAGIYTELLERPQGQIHAEGSSSRTRVKNQGMLWFAAADGKAIDIEGQRLDGTTFSGSYHGQICLTVGRNGALVVVNTVPENQLLAGLVPAEIFPGAPDEALKAQAVAARGELLAKIGLRHAGEPFRLCAETHCQVYAGAARETPRTTAAVEATRGEVLFVADHNDLVDTVYSANCGGHGEHNDHAWLDMPVEVSLRGHIDGPPAASFAAGINATNIERFLSAPPPTFCGQAKLQGAGDRFRWTVTRTAAELATLLAPYKLGRIQAIDVKRRGVSGRATEITIVGSARSETLRGELTIRRAFGNLRSSLFVAEVVDGAVRFRGGGFGHGVGLCQTGSIGMAEARKSYRDILSHYYQRSVLRKLW
ncbi:MAG TPA: SpoIID/LytB domain-containing protein [Polyangia bacterium]